MLLERDCSRQPQSASQPALVDPLLPLADVKTVIRSGTAAIRSRSERPECRSGELDN